MISLFSRARKAERLFKPTRTLCRDILMEPTQTTTQHTVQSNAVAKTDTTAPTTADNLQGTLAVFLLPLYFKLQVWNVGKYTSKNDVLRIFKKNGFDSDFFKSMRKNPKADFAVVSFHNQVELEKGKQLLETLKHPKTGQTFSVSNYIVQRLTADDFTGAREKRGARANNEVEGEQTCPEDNIVPLRNVEYPEQLKQKQKEIVKVLKKIKREMVKFETKICGRDKSVLPFWLQDDFMKKDINWEEMKAKRQKLENGAASESSNLPIFPEYNTGEIRNACCPVEKILPSPAIDEYRNKCEFTFGFDKNKAPALGFRSGSFKNRDLSIVRPNEAWKHVQKEMKTFCSEFEKVVLAESPFPVYDVIQHTGVWRQVTIRTTETEMLLVFQIHKGNMESDEEFQLEVERIRGHFYEKKTGAMTISSINFVFYDGNSVQESKNPDVTIGAKVITQKLLDYNFEISPSAFFQTNTKGAAVLYNLVGEKVRKILETSGAEEVVLLDVCCGTGTIGLSLAKEVKAVIGVDNNKDGILNARRNAEMNGITNALFLASNAEHVLGFLFAAEGKRYNNTAKMEKDSQMIAALDETEQANFKEIQKLLKETKANEKAKLVAVVDPPRSGLHSSVVRALRQAELLDHVIYVSCSPTGSFITDAKGLCATENTKRRPGVPFYPVEATPVDMFPHTRHMELVTLFSRLPTSELEKLRLEKEKEKEKEKENATSTS